MLSEAAAGAIDREEVSGVSFNRGGADGWPEPLFDGFAQVAINPKFVAGWQFPGVTSAGYGHWHLIKAAR